MGCALVGDTSVEIHIILWITTLLPVTVDMTSCQTIQSPEDPGNNRSSVLLDFSYRLLKWGDPSDMIVKTEASCQTRCSAFKIYYCLKTKDTKQILQLFSLPEIVTTWCAWDIFETVLYLEILNMSMENDKSWVCLVRIVHNKNRLRTSYIEIYHSGLL